MPNSADKPIGVDPSLDEDSDVIELTEEVAEEDGFDLFDDFAMPEFRMPGESPKPADAEPQATPANGATPAKEAPEHEAKPAPGAAIFGRQGSRPRQETPMMETLKLGLSDIEAAMAKQRAEKQPEETTSSESFPPEVEEVESLGALEESSVISLEVEAEPAPVAAEPEPEPVAPIADEPEPLTAQVPSLDDLEQSEPEEDDNTATAMIGGKMLDPTESYAEPKHEHEPEPEDELVLAPADGEPGFDRQELVRTMQMQAVDRKEIGTSIDLERLDGATALDDQRFAPDVLIAPPRVLTKQWREGSPLEQAPTSKPPPVKAAPPKAAPPKITPQQPAAPQQPQQPAAPAVAATPAQPATPPQPAAAPPTAQPQQRPAQPQNAAGTPAPGRPVASTPVDSEMKGLVKELLDEGQPAPKPKPKRKASPRDNWFREVFTEEYLRTLPPNLEQVTERDCKFIERSLSLQPGSRILDLACGFGRHALALAPRKYDVVGLDLSMALLQRGLAEAQRRSLSIKFVHGDMRSMNFNAIFDGCYLWQTSFGYFDDPTNFKVLQGIHHSLKPGGRFLLDIINRDFVISEMPSRCWWEGRECIFLEETDFDHLTSTLHTKRSFIYEDGSPPLEQNSYVRLYSLHELLAIFPRAGFRILEVSGELHHRARFLGANSPRIVILAEKVVPPNAGQQQNQGQQGQPQPQNGGQQQS